MLELSTLTLSTTNREGEPHAAPVYFVAFSPAERADAPRLYFFSDPDSRHTLDAQHDPRVAAAIYPECRGWQDIRGLQMRGEVHLVPRGEEWDTAWELYRQKFPFVSAFQSVVARNHLYVFTPRWIRLLDNRRGFGYKREWSLP